MQTNNFGLTIRDIDTIQHILNKYPSIKMISIFGSRAKGNYKASSDIDMAILDENVDHKVIRQLLSDFEESSLPYKVDVVNFHDLKNEALREHILRVGVRWE